MEWLFTYIIFYKTRFAMTIAVCTKLIWKQNSTSFIKLKHIFYVWRNRFLKYCVWVKWQLIKVSITIFQKILLVFGYKKKLKKPFFDLRARTWTYWRSKIIHINYIYFFSFFLFKLLLFNLQMMKIHCILTCKVTCFILILLLLSPCTPRFVSVKLLPHV